MPQFTKQYKYLDIDQEENKNIFSIFDAKSFSNIKKIDFILASVFAFLSGILVLCIIFFININNSTDEKLYRDVETKVIKADSLETISSNGLDKGNENQETNIEDNNEVKKDDKISSDHDKKPRLIGFNSIEELRKKMSLQDDKNQVVLGEDTLEDEDLQDTDEPKQSFDDEMAGIATEQRLKAYESDLDLNMIENNLIGFVNKKYGFKFDFVDNQKIATASSDKITTYDIDVSDNEIKVTTIIDDLQGDITQSEQDYLLYDASLGDGDRLRSWWEENIDNEMGGLEVPDDYEISENNLPFFDCLVSINPDYVVPPTLRVFPKEEIRANTIDEDLDPLSTYYMYYDYSKPFILSFRHRYSGSCNRNDVYLVISTIAKFDILPEEEQ